MAEFATLAIDQYRHQFVVFRFERRIGIDIQHLDGKQTDAGLVAQGFQRNEHVLAQVAVVAAIQPQSGRLPARRIATYRTGP